MSLRNLALSAILAGALATPAMATGEPSTRVIECRSGSCLVILGRRDHAATPVSVNGHAVAVEGARKWRAVVPVETVREWSAPFARTITVSVAGAEEEARLPIGLLGRAENLAMLIVKVK